jgi:perosamine synthetase
MGNATVQTKSNLIPLSEPSLDGNEWKYVKDCLDTNWVSSVGSYVDRFEQMVADFVGTRYATAAVNGTAALHIALLMANIEPDDEVLVSTLTFIAPANAVRYAGAWPVLIDVEPAYWQMDPQRLTDFLKLECSYANGAWRNKRTGRRVRAVLPVHILGHPCEMDSIIQIAREFELRIIEDATESLGAHYKDSMVGHLGDVACFSFNGNKIMTTGGGGMIVTDNESWAARGRYLTTQAKDDPIEYLHQEVGYNYRLPNVLAALGCAQMEQLPAFIEKRRAVAATYTAAFENVNGLTPMSEAPWARSIFWLYTLLVNEAEFGLDSRALMHRLAAAGIQSRPLWLPLHLSPINRDLQTYGGEVAACIQRQALSLPSSASLTPSDQQTVIEAVTSSHG